MTNSYWWRTVPNLGDMLAPVILTWALRRPVAFSTHGQRIIGLGSILWATRAGDTVWGTGWHPYAEKEWSPAGIEFLAVRGPITRDYILSNGGACPELYGDPAELLPQLYKPKVESNSSMGIVAHIFDDVGKSFFGNQINVSDPKWPKTIDKIASCKIIASSALHGIIIAEAYGIPAIWVKCSEHEAKYKEYFEVTGRPDAKPVEWSDVLDADPLPPPVKRDLTPFLNALRNRFGE